MVILTVNVQSKAGLLPAGSNVDGVLPEEVIKDLIECGQATETDAPAQDPVTDNSTDDETIDLDALNKDQLKALADEIGLEYPHNLGEKKLRQRIFDHFEAEQGE